MIWQLNMTESLSSWSLLCRNCLQNRDTCQVLWEQLGALVCPTRWDSAEIKRISRSCHAKKMCILDQKTVCMKSQGRREQEVSWEQRLCEARWHTVWGVCMPNDEGRGFGPASWSKDKLKVNVKVCAWGGLWGGKADPMTLQVGTTLHSRGKRNHWSKRASSDF